MKTVFMFSGQGAQYAGMGKTCMKTTPLQKKYLTEQMRFWDIR